MSIALASNSGLFPEMAIYSTKETKRTTKKLLLMCLVHSDSYCNKNIPLIGWELGGGGGGGIILNTTKFKTNPIQKGH